MTEYLNLPNKTRRRLAGQVYAAGVRGEVHFTTTGALGDGRETISSLEGEEAGCDPEVIETAAWEYIGRPAPFDDEALWPEWVGEVKAAYDAACTAKAVKEAAVEAACAAAKETPGISTFYDARAGIIEVYAGEGSPLALVVVDDRPDLVGRTRRVLAAALRNPGPSAEATQVALLGLYNPAVAR